MHVASLALASMEMEDWGDWAPPGKRWWLCRLPQAVRQTCGAPSKLLGYTANVSISVMNCCITLGLLTGCLVGKMGNGMGRNHGIGIIPSWLETLLTSLANKLTGLKLIAKMLSVSVCKYYLLYHSSSGNIATSIT